MAARVVTQLRQHNAEDKSALVGISQTSVLQQPSAFARVRRPKLVRWWVLVPATVAPVLLIGGFLVATALQPASYSPVHDTISSLAAYGATDPWVMTTALVGLGICYLLTALGLRSASSVGRVALTGGGIATLLIAVFRQPRHGYSLAHELAVIAAALTMCTWPALASNQRRLASPLLHRVNISAAVVSCGLAAWYALESHTGQLGIAERCAAAAPALWLLPIVIATRRALNWTKWDKNLPDGTSFVQAASESMSSSSS